MSEVLVFTQPCKIDFDTLENRSLNGKEDIGRLWTWRIGTGDRSARQTFWRPYLYVCTWLYPA